jgi:D-sedoheptulose 7-phosphate isomerase
MLENFNHRIDLRKSLLDQLKSQKIIFEAIELMKFSIKKGSKILIFGNGGSATQSSHFAAELVNKFYLDRRGLPAISLTSNEGNVTSIGNDSGFKYIFSKQVEALGEPDDIAFGITTGGKSENILEAIMTAKANQLKTICLCGQYIDRLQKAGTDIIITVNSADTPAIQEIHLFILHIMAETLEKSIFGDRKK